MNKNTFKIKEILEITLGVLSVSIAFYYLFLPANLVTGGVTGLSIIFKNWFTVSDAVMSVFIFVMNGILLLLGAIIIGKDFFFKTIYGTLLLPFLTLIFSLLPISNTIFLDSIENVHYKLIIISTLGAVLTGVGLGLVFKNNATTGGTDVIQRILYEKLKVPYSAAIYLTDGVIIALGFYFFGIDNTYFAIIAIIISGTVVDKVILSGRSGYTLFIVTNEYQQLKEQIYLKLDRGITKASVVGGYSEKERDMIICTITRNQLYHLKGIISEVDPGAFTFITKTSESVGQGFN